MTKGIRTTEFWVTLLGVIGSVASVIAAGATAGIAPAIATGAYALSRAIVKAKAGDTAGAVKEVAGAVQGASKR